jgi:hypothetical protein
MLPDHTHLLELLQLGLQPEEAPLPPELELEKELVQEQEQALVQG